MRRVISGGCRDPEWARVFKGGRSAPKLHTDAVDGPYFAASMCQDRGRWLNATDEGAAHMQVTTIGLDIAKMVCSQKANSA